MNARSAQAIASDQTSFAEQSVIGGLLLDNGSLDRVADILTADDFYRREHRLIFNAIAALCEENSPADVVTVSEWLERSGELEAAGGLAYIGSLANNTPTAANIVAYAAIVRDQAMLRAVAAAAKNGDADSVRRIVGRAITRVVAPPLKVLDAGELLAINLPPRVNLLDPWLPTQGLAMLHAPRGVGKTWCSLEIAYAIASGSELFGRWKATAPAGVMYVDGEMPLVVMQERLARIVASHDKALVAPLTFITPDVQAGGTPDLATADGQAAVDAALTDETKLVIVDNLSCLVRSVRENEGDDWRLVQSWALRQRAKGRSILFLHHDGKSGKQRGTSRREDVLDAVLSLRRPADYSPKNGAVFEIHFEKARGIHGDDVEPFEASLTTDANGRQSWTTRSIEQSTAHQVAALLQEGLSQKEVAEELNLNKSSVSRAAKKAKELGLYVVPGGNDDD